MLMSGCILVRVHRFFQKLWRPFSSQAAICRHNAGQFATSTLLWLWWLQTAADSHGRVRMSMLGWGRMQLLAAVYEALRFRDLGLHFCTPQSADVHTVMDRANHPGCLCRCASSRLCCVCFYLQQGHVLRSVGHITDTHVYTTSAIPAQPFAQRPAGASLDSDLLLHFVLAPLCGVSAVVCEVFNEGVVCTAGAACLNDHTQASQHLGCSTSCTIHKCTR